MHDLSFLQRFTLTLTSQLDSQSLARALIEVLAQSGWVAHATLLEAYEKPAEATLPPGEALVRLFDVELGIAHRSPPDMRGVREALRGSGPTILPAADGAPVRIVLPIAGHTAPRRLLVLDDPSDNPLLRMQLMHLADLFGNQLRLIESRERDQLTGLLNRQAFTQIFLQLSSGAADQLGHELWLAVLDIDHFKRVNDSYGHLLGDEVLLRFSRVMESSFRYNDRLFRFGGEEFLVLMRTDEEGAGIALERFRAAVEAYDFPCVGQVTVSIGYAHAVLGALAPDLVDVADQALYKAKHAGRNCIVMAHQVPLSEVREAGNVELF
jgi:diguanylate cyclase